ncbi:MAG: crossover junction endodeoxyribonuclease RuvC [Candidatus Eisenbacteria bacterium]
MVVLGIDPGIKRTGYAVVEGGSGMAVVLISGALTTTPRAPFHERLKQVYHGLTEIVGRFQPDEIAIEDVFVKNNVRVALRLGHVRGVALLVAATHNVPIGEYSPGEIKQAIVGSGAASKEQIRFMVTALLHLADMPGEDEADALAAALCHIHRRRLGEDSALDILHKRYTC